MKKTSLPQKLIVTIVRKDRAKKVVEASQSFGAKGGTTLLGNGFRITDKSHFLGIPVEREREIILTVVPADIYPQVMNAIVHAVHLNKPKHGVGFVIDTKQMSGISHMLGIKEDENMELSNEGGFDIMKEQEVLYDLIVTIVNRGESDKVVDASKSAGAEGGTILHGRGTGIHEKAKLFNILIEPEKEIVLTLISRNKTQEVLQAIEEQAELNKPGKGIAFILEVEKTVGINHILNRRLNEEWEDYKKN